MSQLKRWRSISQVLSTIKKEDKGTAITRYYIEHLIKNNKINYSRSGNKYLVDLDEVLKSLGK